MTMLLENNYSMLFRLIISPIIMTEQKGLGYQGIRSIEVFQSKIKEVTSNVAITEKDEKQYARL